MTHLFVFLTSNVYQELALQMAKDAFPIKVTSVIAFRVSPTNLMEGELSMEEKGEVDG
jgi:hypothetical protein